MLRKGHFSTIIALTLIKSQDHGHRNKTQAILALNQDPFFDPNLQLIAS
jgi:hypothetical protein